MEESVRHLDTAHFNETMTAYSNYITQFEEIVRGVNSTAKTMVDNWKGKGRNAFEKDYKTVQLNLKDITDIMYDMRDALIDAHAQYIETDSSLSKSFES